MRAVVKSKPAPGVEFAEVPKPKIKPDEVLIEVKAAAICGSDLGIYDYTPAYSKMKLPVVMGHEFSGRATRRAIASSPSPSRPAAHASSADQGTRTSAMAPHSSAYTQTEAWLST